MDLFYILFLQKKKSMTHDSNRMLFLVSMALFYTNISVETCHSISSRFNTQETSTQITNNATEQCWKFTRIFWNFIIFM